CRRREFRSPIFWYILSSLPVSCSPLLHLRHRGIQRALSPGFDPSSYLKLIRKTDRLVDAIVVSCEFLRRHLEKDENVPTGRIQLCYELYKELVSTSAGVVSAS